jgi:hypothetical protein
MNEAFMIASSLMESFHTRQNKRDRFFGVFLDRFWTQVINTWTDFG